MFFFDHKSLGRRRKNIGLLNILGQEIHPPVLLSLAELLAGPNFKWMGIIILHIPRSRNQILMTNNSEYL